MTNNKNCIGCDLHSTCDKPSSINDQVCPCTICLIKTMCQAGCEEYTEYRIYLLSKGIYYDQ